MWYRSLSALTGGRPWSGGRRRRSPPPASSSRRGRRARSRTHSGHWSWALSVLVEEARDSVPGLHLPQERRPLAADGHRLGTPGDVAARARRRRDLFPLTGVLVHAHGGWVRDRDGR